MSNLEDQRIVPLQVFDNPIFAHIIKARLEANNISCFLADEHTIGMNPLYSNALGGVKLMVFEQDVDRCRQILLADDSLPSETETNEEDAVACPHCQSTDVSYGNATKKRFGWFTLIVSLLLLVYPFYSKKAWHCYNCGEDF